MKRKQWFALVAFTIIGAIPAHAGIWEFLFGAGKNASPIADRRNVIQRVIDNRRFYKDKTWKNRVVNERNPNYLDDLSYLDEKRYSNQTLGFVDTRFIKEFDTRFYYYSSAKPNTDAVIPMADPDAKALFIFFHGSGTAKANGGNFAVKMNKLGLMGYASIGFDMPFHNDGSRNPALARTGNFINYVHDIIESVRVPGQPVYLVGHSFGPDIIAETITRYPHLVDGAAMISPGSFDKETKKWFEEKTVRMTKLFGDAVDNMAGGNWAGQVTSENTWSNPKKRIDPTVANPKLKLMVISGEWEEYIPGPLDADGIPAREPRTYDVCGTFQKLFSRVDCIIEPKVGHYIFEHTDANGHDVIMRTFLGLAGEDIANEKQIRLTAGKKIEGRAVYEKVASQYSKDLFFRNWVNQDRGGLEAIKSMIANQDNKLGNQLIKDFKMIENNREKELFEHIRATKDWAPDFYQENEDLILKLGDRSFEYSGLVKKYADHLKKLPDSYRSKYTTAAKTVYAIPEKVIPDWVKEKLAKEAAEKAAQNPCNDMLH